ncbi:hypothetical protein H5T88_06545 [bacterium]|nr:hypothetical protein [bacterium]
MERSLYSSNTIEIAMPPFGRLAMTEGWTKDEIVTPAFGAGIREGLSFNAMEKKICSPFGFVANSHIFTYFLHSW